jgi:hypothetical protein
MKLAHYKHVARQPRPTLGSICDELKNCGQYVKCLVHMTICRVTRGCVDRNYEVLERVGWAPTLPLSCMALCEYSHAFKFPV